MSMFRQPKLFHNGKPIMEGEMRIMISGDSLTFWRTIHAQKVVNGRKFRAEVKYDEFDMLGENDLIRMAFLKMQEELSLFDADTKPVPNGPEDAVWLAECLTQAELVESDEEARNWIRRRRAARGQP